MVSVNLDVGYVSISAAQPSGGTTTAELTQLLTSAQRIYTLDGPGVVSIPGNEITQVVGTYNPGQVIATPIQISGSGYRYWDWASYSAAPGDQIMLNAFSGASTTVTRTIWFIYTASATGEFTIIPDNVPNSGWYWAFYLESAATWTNPGTWAFISFGATEGNSVAIGSVSSGSSVLLCFAPTDSYDTSGQLNWDVYEPVGDIVMDVLTPTLLQSPGAVRVSLMGAAPGESATFYVVGDGTPLMSDVCDSTGQIIGATVPVPAMAAGSAVVRAVLSGGDFTEGTFQILHDPPVRPTTPPADVPPPTVTLVDVIKWTFRDPAPGGESYVLPFNPGDMDPPHRPRDISAEHTVAPDGQPILWEGAPKAWSWQFSGYTEDDDYRAALERFLALRHRFWLTDHRSRGWVVSFDHIDWKPKRSATSLSGFEYTVAVTIWRGPVVVS